MEGAARELVGRRWGGSPYGDGVEVTRLSTYGEGKGLGRGLLAG